MKINYSKFKYPIILFFLGVHSFLFSSTPKIPKTNFKLSFTENKGQISDQNHLVRPDVLFSGTDGQFVFHLKKNGISYQFNKIEEGDYYTEQVSPKNIRLRMPGKITVYRIDMNWLNTNPALTTKRGNPLPGYTNYYLPSCKDGALNVQSFEEVLYKDLYSGIDLKWYESNGKLEYDYLVRGGFDYHQIQMEILGAKNIKVNDKGGLVIETPFGTMVQPAPVVKQNKKKVKARWVLNNSKISFDIRGIDFTKDFVIDPIVRTWGTYNGGSGNESGNFSSMDANGNVFVAGQTTSGTTTRIATSGVQQTSFGGFSDAFITKFNSNGVRQWGTYYGDTEQEFGNCCATDNQGNVYLVGQTTTTVGNILGTPGSHQPTFGGGFWDAYLAKFDANGIRLWGTYYGGTIGDFGNTCTTDPFGNVYIGGYTNSNNGNSIATPGSHQPTADNSNNAYLAKFNSSGVRQWGTYYGDNLVQDIIWSSATDAQGNVYVAGETMSTSNGTAIATVGSHQPQIGGPAKDAFLVKFDPNGVRQWGTFYGGTGQESGFCATDNLGNVFLAGFTQTTTGTIIATPGSHQPTYGGGPYDAFLAKFDASGVRLWGTYYGGTGSNAENSFCSTDASGNVYLTGITNSTASIATSGNHQTTFSGGFSDGFIVKFNKSGVRQWGSYYGGTGDDQTNYTLIDASNNIYVVGYSTTNSGTAIATPGSHQSSYGGGANGDAFLVKFADCTPPDPLNITANQNLIICSGNSASLSASGTGTLNWYTANIGGTVIASGNVFVTPILSVTTTFYVEDNGCVPSANRTPITVTVIPTPSVVLNGGSICKGNSFTITANGAQSYTYSSGNSVVSPTATASYTVIGSSPGGCTNIAVTTITVNPSPSVTASTSFTSVCAGNSITLNGNGAVSYTWSNGVVNGISFSPSSSGVYTVSGTDVNGCVGSTTMNVIVKPFPNISITPNVIIQKGASTQLIVSGGDSYTWTPSSELSCSTCSNPLAGPLQTTQFCVEVSLASCTNTACVIVSIDTSCDELFVPNAFSPNGDGENDDWKVMMNADCVTSFNVKVFDRLGEIVFQSTSIDNTWNGSYKGNALNNAVFVYVLEITLKNNPDKIIKKGNISLIK